MNTSSIEACFPPRSRKVKSFCSVLITKSVLEAVQKKLIDRQTRNYPCTVSSGTNISPDFDPSFSSCMVASGPRTMQTESSPSIPSPLFFLRSATTTIDYKEIFNIIISINRIGQGLTGGTKCQAMCLHGFRSIAKERSTPQHKVPLQRPR